MSCSSARVAIARLVARLLLLSGLFSSLGGCDSGAKSPAKGQAVAADARWQLQQQFKLPPELREVSGLAETASGTLLAVADEQALIFEIDLQAGTAAPWLAIGEPILAGDFEGIELIGERVWLVDSDGGLLWSDGEQYDQVVTGLGATCEIEGLAQDPLSKHLLLLCKQARSKTLAKDRLYLHAVSAESGSRVPAGDLSFDLQAALATLQVKNLRPSGVSFDPAGERLAVVAAKQQALLVFARDGTLIQASALPAQGQHRQAEGVVVLRDGRLAIADEGGKKRGRLTVYNHVL